MPLFHTRDKTGKSSRIVLRYQRYLYSCPSSPQGGISPLAVHIQSQSNKKLGERLSPQAYGEFKVQHVL